MKVPAENARFADIGGGMRSELIANQVQLFYDPTSGSARAMFNALPYLQLGGKYQALGANNDILAVDFNPRMMDCLGEGTDPVTGTDLSTLSVAGFMLIIKSAYDKFVQERADKIAADIAAAEAAALAAQQAADAQAAQDAADAANNPPADPPVEP